MKTPDRTDETLEDKCSLFEDYLNLPKLHYRNISDPLRWTFYDNGISFFITALWYSLIKLLELNNTLANIFDDGRNVRL